MINTPALVTEQGDIRIHNREGGKIVVAFNSAEGTPRNMRNSTVVFETSKGFRKNLVPGTAPEEVVLQLDPMELMGHLNNVADFVVRDETTPEKAVVWQGHITVTGW